MSSLNPNATTVNDLCSEALRESGAFGIGQSPLAEDLTGAWARLQWMLQQWERKRWLVYHLVTYGLTCTGAQSYTVGPGGNFSTGGGSTSPFGPAFGPAFGAGTPALTARPNRIESCFLRQLTQPVPVDYPMQRLESMEDYNRLGLKTLTSFPYLYYYDPAWPLGVLYPWPVPQASIYGLYISVREQLPVQALTASMVLDLPYEYYAAILYNLALRLRPKYGIVTFSGDVLPGLAKDALNVLRTGNLQVSGLKIPTTLSRPGIYNIFSDRNY